MPTMATLGITFPPTVMGMKRCAIINPLLTGDDSRIRPGERTVQPSTAEPARRQVYPVLRDLMKNRGKALFC